MVSPKCCLGSTLYNMLEKFIQLTMMQQITFFSNYFHYTCKTDLFFKKKNLLVKSKGARHICLPMGTVK